GAALRHRAQLRGVTEHLGQRHFSLDDLRAARRIVHALHEAATTVQVAHDVTHVVFRRFHLDLHDRLEQHGAGLLHAFLEAHGAGDLERHFVRVDVMVGTVEQGDLDVHDREAGDDAILHGLLDALVDRRDILLRHHAANDGVDKLVARARLLRLDAQPDMTVLTATTRLAHELAFLLHGLANGLAVGHLRRTHVRLDLELALHAIDED